MTAHLDFFALSIEPFSKEIEDKDLWLPPSKKSLVDELVDAIEARESVVLTGEPGVGKTCVLRALRHALPADRFRLTYSHNATLGRRDFYRQLCLALGASPSATAAAIFHAVAATRPHHRTQGAFCGRCGTPTAREVTERFLACPQCGLRHYPQISPAILTLVRKGDRALLASNAKFPGAFYSTLAGFADIGESLEETLRREVKEEVGLEVANLRYFGSQPWPFPSSLMLAFTAEWASGDIVVDTSELADAQWFAANALPMLPPPLSIARALIDAWLEEVKA